MSLHNQSLRPLQFAKPLFKAQLLLLILVSGAIGLSLQAKQPNNSGLAIENFGKVNDNYFRGAQPKEREFYRLKQLGIKTIIDLQDDGPNEEAHWVRNAGMQYINIPLSSKRAAGDSRTVEFLRAVNDASLFPVYVHCAGGRHRTGEMTAIYRITHDGWSADQAFNEMKQFDWYSFGGHGATKDYVFDFYGRYRNNQIPRIQTGSSTNGVAKDRLP